MWIKGLILLVAAACTAAPPPPPVGVQRLFPEVDRQYIYAVKSNISSGTLLPVESASHWTLEGKLHIQVSNYTSVRCRLDQVKTSVYSKLHAQQSNLPEDAEALKKPWEIQYQPSGTVYSIHLPSDDPLWASNIKRALSLILQMQKPEGISEISYNVNEPCLYGVCSVEYTCVDGATVRKSYDIPAAEPGYGRYMWNSVPLDSCAESHSKPTVIGSTDRVYRVDETKGLQHFELRSTLQYHSQNHLLAVTSVLSMNFDNDAAPDKEEKLDLVSSYPGYYPHFYKEPSNGRSVQLQESLFNATKRMLLKISKGIDAENIVRNSSIIHSLDLIDLHKTMSQLDYEYLMKMYEELAVGTSYDIETCRNIYLEVVAYVKTSHCALFVKYLVVEQKHHIEDSTILSLVRKLPFNVANYSQDLLDQMESFTRLGPDFNQDIRHACILSFATLAYHTFRNGGCSADYFENIVVKYFRMYSDCPQYLDRMIWLQGLSNLQVGSVYTYLAPKILSQETNRHERYFGLLSTLQSAAVDPIVGTVLAWPILTNEEEHIQLRTAALLQLLASDLTPGRLLALHQYVSRSRSHQLRRFWYTTVRSLERSQYNCYQPMARYTSFVSKLVTSPDARYWATGNFIVDSRDDEANSAAMVQLMSVGDPLTGLPEVVHLNVRMSQGGMVTTNIGVMIKAEGVSLGLFRRIHKMDSETLHVERLLEMLKKMKVQIVNPQKVHIEIVTKIHDKTVFATHMNQSTFDGWNGKDLAQSVQDFLQFGSHINQQTITYPLQMDLNLPTELGTPLTLQTTFSSFSSIRGNLSAPFTTHALTWKNDVHLRYQATMVTSLFTAGPLLPSDHTVRIQQSMVAHLPLKFDVSLSPETRSFQLKWPNPGSQNGGVAMHARAQIAMTSPHATVTDYTVDTAENKYSVDESGIFFDCDRPMSGVELVEKLIDTNKSNYDFLASLRPSMVLLHGLFLLSVPPTGSCGVILPPTRPLQKSEDNVLEVQVEVQQLEFSMEESFKLKIAHAVAFRESRDQGAVYLNVSGVSSVENTRERAAFSLTLSGEQPHAVDPAKRKWKICLDEHDLSHDASDQDISPYPSAYEGNVTLSMSAGDIPQECPDNGTSFALQYKGHPAGMYGAKGIETLLDVKVTGQKLPKLSLPSSGGVDSPSSLTQLIHKLNQDPLNVSAVIKARNGLTSLRLDQGPELQFKSENFNWLLDNWNNMQIMKKFGIYRECRLQETTVHTLLGAADRLPATHCAVSLALADCSETPRFALLREKSGGYRLYTGGNYVAIEPAVGAPVVKVNEEVVDYSEGYVFPVNETVYDFKISRAGETVKVHSRISGIILYYKAVETIILVPDLYLSIGCGSCLSQHYYKLC